MAAWNADGRPPCWSPEAASGGEHLLRLIGQVQLSVVLTNGCNAWKSTWKLNLNPELPRVYATVLVCRVRQFRLAARGGDADPKPAETLPNRMVRNVLAPLCWPQLGKVAVVDVDNDVLAGSDQTGRSDHRSRQQWLTLATMCWSDQIRLVEVTAGQDSSG